MKIIMLKQQPPRKVPTDDHVIGIIRSVVLSELAHGVAGVRLGYWFLAGTGKPKTKSDPWSPLRSFMLEDGWRETDNLGYEDMLPAAKLLDLAHTWVMHQLAADAKGRKQADPVTAR